MYVCMYVYLTMIKAIIIYSATGSFNRNFNTELCYLYRLLRHDNND